MTVIAEAMSRPSDAIETSKAPRSPRRERKTRQILEAARRLFTDNGYDPTSMEAIAKQAKVGKATLYAIFSSKEDLFAEVVKAEGEAPSRAILLQGETTDPRAALAQFARAFFDFLLSPDNVAMYRSIGSAGPRFGALGHIFYRNGPQVVLGKLDAFLARAMQRGQIRPGDSRMAASQFIGLIRGDLQTKALLGFDHDELMTERDRVIEGGLDVFWRAYGATKSEGRD